MIDKGLIIKEGSHKNNYGGVYKLTKSGFAAAEKVKQKVNIAVDAASKNLSDENRKALYDSLELISANLRDLVVNGIPD